MSRRSNKKQGGQRSNQQNQPKKMGRVLTEMDSDGRIYVDPHFTPAAIQQLDRLYHSAGREDYDPRWHDEHKIAFFLFHVFDEILQKYEPPETPYSDLDPAPGVPSLRDAPIRDVVDISSMSRANLNN